MIVGVFPGQGNQYMGMGQDVFENHKTARLRSKYAAKVTGIDIPRISHEGTPEEQREPVNLQLITYVHSCFMHDILKEETGLDIFCYAGHSVGEYAALYAANSFSFADGARIVKKRAEFMKRDIDIQRFPDGHFLVALLGADVGEVKRLCLESGLQVALYNSPGNIVIGGHPDLIEEWEEKMPGRPRKLGVPGPFHTKYFVNAGESLKEYLKGLDLRVPEGLVYSNYTAEPYEKDIEDPILHMIYNLAEQLSNPVRWMQIIQNMPDLELAIEMGPGKSLAGMIKKTRPEVKTLSVQDMPSLESAVAELSS
ncbi:MAG: ACP S-malonyltransferase [Nanoarchaeota archaeon]|nr:ACP S-malonyltransferase [Nanoarchaeota archaeon]